MTQKISPRDLISPIGKPLYLYQEACDTENPIEAAIYAVILNNSQMKNAWTPTNHFPVAYEKVISQMEKNGSLVKVSEKEGFVISKEKILQLLRINNF